MNVRPTTAADREAIIDVHERSVYELAGEHYREAVLDAWTDLSQGDDSDGEATEDDVQPENGRRYVAEVEGRVVGFSDVRFDPPEYLEEPVDGGVRAVYVDPDVAGEGVGSSLLATLETTARENGLGSLGLLASLNARGFYEHHGYEIVAETTFQYGEDIEGPAVEMRTDL
ncbi:GNAT family N-acetyltransferase [Salinarchaeum laminariae]|uniref:GNAT family N-acetyltransferase n=1 Tax=Salinarchaeum laminariae TaxID=869888 RepID=UPI0020C13830|nr:GNAT family N-acetyltransferase [Salinarchaeum laminariae]